MKLLLAVTAVAALAQSAAAASCAIATLSKLLLNQYIDQCSDDSGYGFATGVKPTETEVAGMCASDACHSLLADVEAMNLTECTLPIGDKISLFADLIDYVSDQCNADTPTPTTATPEPTTAAPTPTTATPAPTTAITSCTSAQLRYLLTSTYEAQCVKDTSYSFTSPTTPTEANVAAMCASESCVNLFAYVSSMVTTDCRIPVGGKILLLADLVDYVTDQCEADTPAPTTAAPEPTTAAPTPEPTTAPTPAPTAAIASCTSAQLRYLLTSTYEAQCIADTGYSFTAPTSPTDANVAAMCASESCVNLFDYVASMVTTDCRIPVGGKILLLADLVDYVSDQCDASTPAPATEDPSTPVPTTETPTTPSPTTATPVATCKTSVLSALLTNQYIDQCGDDSGYSFTSGKQPDAEEVAGMCASTACANLLADVEALGLSECILPIGDKIYLFRDLVDYVSDQCAGSTTPSTTAPATEDPSTPVPTTETPDTETPGTESPGTETPATTTPSPGTESPATPMPNTETPGTEPPTTESPTTNTPTTNTPTTETPEPTSPTHDAC